MAAAYLYHLVRNHAFVDGNKRIGALACDQFLFLNDLDLTLTEEQLVQCVLAVATGKMSKEELTLLIRQHVRPLS